MKTLFMAIAVAALSVLPVNAGKSQDCTCKDCGGSCCPCECTAGCCK